MADTIHDEALEAMHATAVDLATLAGAEIVRAQGRALAVRYKGGDGSFSDPVSDVDEAVERMIRLALAEQHPDHAIIGEEMEAQPATASAFTWAIDPVDGTANFVNGFPMHAASVGVLHEGRPVVGAIWCATSHALRPGVYHGRAGGPLMFEGQALERHPIPTVRRRLAGVPRPLAEAGPWETRKTGSAALECAFVAAGLMQAARFDRPNLWDVAAGVLLVQLGEGRVLERQEGRWQPFERFDPAGMARWRAPLILGNLPEDQLVTHLGEV